jgi:hypothetical protein
MLVGDRLKYLGLVGGLAFAALLVTQQASIFTGYALRTGAWIRDTSSADLWIMDPQQEHTDDQKRMISTSLQRIRSVDGVDWAVPMFKGYMPARLADGRVHQIRVVGLDDATLEGAPPGMQVGSLADLRSDRAVFINRTDTDKKLALRKADGTTRPLTVGDRIDISAEGESDNISLETVDDGASLFARSAVGGVDRDLFAGLLLPVLGKGGIELRVELTGGVVGDVEELLPAGIGEWGEDKGEPE